MLLFIVDAEAENAQPRDPQAAQSPAASSTSVSMGVYAEESVDHIDFTRFNAVVV